MEGRAFLSVVGQPFWDGAFVWIEAFEGIEITGRVKAVPRFACHRSPK